MSKNLTQVVVTDVIIFPMNDQDESQEVDSQNKEIDSNAEEISPNLSNDFTEYKAKKAVKTVQPI
ncbi:MAG: hypothetical protein ACR2MD_17505 [Aridibacter sp.]